MHGETLKYRLHVPDYLTHLSSSLCKRETARTNKWRQF